MSIGERIKRIRTARNMKQADLGAATGLTDVRIRQYELGHRNPKDDKLASIAQALDVNILVLKDPTLFSAEEVMFLLFELEQHYPVGLHEIKVGSDTNGPSTQIGITFEQKLMNDLLKEWLLRKKELKEGKISLEEYNEWKWNWPATCDNCGRMEPKKKWRNS